MVLEISKEPLPDNHPLVGRIIFGAKRPDSSAKPSKPSSDPQAKAYEDALRASRRNTEAPSKEAQASSGSKPNNGDATDQ